MEVSTTQTSSYCSFPDELVFHVLHFLNPCEVIRLRLVSKQFDEISRDPQLWKLLYANARFPRPSGPYPWQSTSFLERSLVHLDRMSSTWTSRHIRQVISTKGPQIKSPRRGIGQSFSLWSPFSFLLGRLIIWFNGAEVLAEDIEANTKRVIWRSNQAILSTRACSMDCPDAQRVVVVVRSDSVANLFSGQPTALKLLIFQLEEDSTRILSGPVMDMNLPLGTDILFKARYPFLYFSGSAPLVIDTRTWIKYRLPAFSTNLDIRVSGTAIPTILLSRRLLIVSRRWKPRREAPKGEMCLLQAFVHDRSQQLDADFWKLPLTHETVFEDVPIPTNILREAIVNPVTGDISVRCLGTTDGAMGTSYSSLDLELSNADPRSKEVLPISINVQDLFCASGIQQRFFFQASEDGYGWGLAVVHPPWRANVLNSSAILVNKFSIDAGGEKCMAVCSEPFQGSEEMISGRADSFDVLQGTICFTHSRVVGWGSLDTEVIQFYY